MPFTLARLVKGHDTEIGATNPLNVTMGLGNPVAHVGAQSAAAAAIGTVVADTGALAVGTYRIEAALAVLGVVAAGKGVIIEHRDAANTATVKVLGACGGGDSVEVVRERLVIAASERVRVVVGTVALGAAETAVASISATLLSA